MIYNDAVNDIIENVSKITQTVKELIPENQNEN